jgi:hypothetical protein
VRGSRRDLLFGLRRRASARPGPEPPTGAGSAPPPAPEPAVAPAFLGLRDIRPRVGGPHAIALPAERALSAEVAQVESPPPWAQDGDGA